MRSGLIFILIPYTSLLLTTRLVQKFTSAHFESFQELNPHERVKKGLGVFFYVIRERVMKVCYLTF